MIAENLNHYERGKARFEWVKANHSLYSISEMAAKLEVTETTIRNYIARIKKTGKYADKPKPAKTSKYDTWDCHKPKKYLQDNFRGLF